MSKSKKPKSDHKYRSCKHGILLYPDDKSHVEALEKIKSAYLHVGILHDKDIDDKGQLKKPHWHVVLTTRNATWNTSISNEIGLALNYIQQIRSEEAAVGYLLHLNEPTKHQYNLSEAFGSPAQVKALEGLAEKGQISEGEKVIELLDVIETATEPITMASFSRYCASNNRWDVFRRSASIFIRMIEEHNKKLKGIEI